MSMEKSTLSLLVLRCIGVATGIRIVGTESSAVKSVLARQSRQRSMSQDFIDRIGGGEADGGSKNDEAAESPYATAL